VFRRWHSPEELPDSPLVRASYPAKQ
jgi:hypothetical protein